MAIITEHSAKIEVKLPAKDVHAKMEVFYNPVMISNRNIAVLLLKSIENKDMTIADPLAGSGVRAIRFLKELPKEKIDKVYVNDKKDHFLKTFTDTLQLNELTSAKLVVRNEDAEQFLLHQHTDDWCGYFDYIEIDPFGSPNPFLSAAVARIKRNGILAVTATDTAALTGTYPKVTRRKYWAEPLKNYLMHEIGLRILIRKVQLQGIQFDKALIPVLAYHKDHYFRIYFRSEKGKEKCDKIVRQHQYFLFNSKNLNFKTSNYNAEENYNQFAGPLWCGQLLEKSLIKKMAKENPFPEEQKFLDLLAKESEMTVVGFIDLHSAAKMKGEEPPKLAEFLKKTNGVRTHFAKVGVKVKTS